jgi:hypothetical protein
MPELAVDYRRSAKLLKMRIDELQGQLAGDKALGKTMCEMEKMRMRRRINALSSMYRQALDTAFIIERDYSGR